VSTAAGRQVALLRGVNVGTAKRVAMADLRTLVESLGYTDVRTLLNSGNVIYTAPGVAPADAAARIEEALAARLGVSAMVVALVAQELTAAVANNPLAEVADNPSRLLVAVPADQHASTRLQPLLEQDWRPEALALGPRVAYLWCPGGVIASRVLAAVGRALGDAVTSRNWATMTKLQALAAEGRG
jgi:uncharacterized protein (DUF1697 family)